MSLSQRGTGSPKHNKPLPGVPGPLTFPTDIPTPGWGSRHTSTATVEAQPDQLYLADMGRIFMKSLLRCSGHLQN